MVKWESQTLSTWEEYLVLMNASAFLLLQRLELKGTVGPSTKKWIATYSKRTSPLEWRAFSWTPWTGRSLLGASSPLPSPKNHWTKRSNHSPVSHRLLSNRILRFVERTSLDPSHHMALKPSLPWQTAYPTFQIDTIRVFSVLRIQCVQVALVWLSESIHYLMKNTTNKATYILAVESLVVYKSHADLQLRDMLF